MKLEDLITLQSDTVAVLDKPRIYLEAKDFGNDDRNSKTLLYGYDCDRNTWHVFQNHHGLVFLHVYKNNLSSYETRQAIDVSGDGVADLQELVPNKRLYPEYCDFQFCAYMKEKGVHLPFTVWSEPRRSNDAFAGEIF
jgi:hypothetical protein